MSDALGNIIDEAVRAVERFTDLVQDPVALKAFLAEFGWTPDSLPKPIADLAAAAAGLIKVIGAADGETSPLQMLSAIKAIVDAVNAIRTNPDTAFPSGIDVAAFRETIGRELLDYLLVEHLLRNRYRLGGLLQLAGIIRLVPTPPAGLRKAYTKREIPWSEIGDLFTDPAKGFREVFAWDSAAPQVITILGQLASLLESYGLQFYCVNATDQQLAFLNAGASEPVKEVLGFDLALLKDGGSPTDSVAGIQLFLRPATANRGSALALLPYAQFDTAQPIAITETLSLAIIGDADFTKGVALTVAPGSPVEVRAGFLGGAATSPAKLQAQLSITPAADQPETMIFGTPDGSRLSVGKAIFTAGSTLISQSTLDAFVQLDLQNLHLVVKPDPGEADSFLASFLGQNGISTELSLGLRSSTISGFHFTGSGGLQGSFPLHLQLGPVTVLAISVALKPATQGLDFQVGALLSGSVGPLSVIIDSANSVFTARFPDPPTGNLGPLDVGFGFAPPEGAGLSVDAAGVSGGGFLGYVEAKHEYSGVLQLEFNDLALEAFGLITTEMAGGIGYSLLALIDANFPPIQLGWGFTLNGVGGLLAMHRTAAVDALRAGLKADALSNILFPKNAITNAPQILAALDTFFPTAPGRFLFGPMALIEWETMLTAALAIIIELPEPVRIVLLARIATRIPSETNTLVRINMDALGVLDLSQSSLALDATLFDSRLLNFPLAGDMALRANWAGQREFLLSVGGFHPRFTPPPGFPTLKRLSIDMPSGIISTLHLETYLAITSNTLQIGANLHVVIGISAFSLEGHLGFDALFQRDPFHFDGDISGSVAVSVEGEDFLSVSLDATLTGPAPWYISGKFKVHIVFFDVHKSFSETWGDDAAAEQIAAVDVGALLAADLSDPRSWGSQLPDGVPALVTTRDLQNSAVVVAHPLARLEVHERTVPLGLGITRFGAAPLSGANHFAISDFQIGGTAVTYQSVEDDFAPAQFFDLTDDEKLEQPSFERHDAGVRMDGGRVSSGAPQRLVTNGSSVNKTLQYETFFVDQPGGELRTDDPKAPKYTRPIGEIETLLSSGSAGRATMMRAGNRRYTAPGNPIHVAEPAFVVVDTATLAPAGLGPVSGNVYSDARALLREQLNQFPGQQGHLQIVATHEMMLAA